MRRLICTTLVTSATVVLRRFLLRLVVFLVQNVGLVGMGAQDLAVFVSLKRFFAPEWVLILGMTVFLPSYCPSLDGRDIISQVSALGTSAYCGLPFSRAFPQPPLLNRPRQKRFMVSSPISGWPISRPRNRMETLTLLPSCKKRRACLAFGVEIRHVDVQGQADLLELHDMLVFRASFSRFDCSKRYLP